VPNTDTQPGAEGPRAEMEVALRGVSVADKESVECCQLFQWSLGQSSACQKPLKGFPHFRHEMTREPVNFNRYPQSQLALRPVIFQSAHIYTYSRGDFPGLPRANISSISH